jgi:hypothetical protein
VLYFYDLLKELPTGAPPASPFFQNILDLSPFNISPRQDETWIWQRSPANIPSPVMGFNQYSWPNPTSPNRIDETWINQGIRATAQVPFNQLDWPNPVSYPRPDVTWVHQLQLSIPFRQTDWPNPVQPNRIDASWLEVGNNFPPLLNVAFPHNQYDWPLPISAFRLDQTDTTYSTPANIPPPVMGLNQYDWPLPRSHPRPDESWVWYFPESDTAYPFNQYSWPLPGQSPRLDETWVWIQQLTPPPVVPHNQYDWPNPKTPQPIDGYWYNEGLRIAVIPLPPTNYDWPVPVSSPRLDYFFVNQVPLLTPVPPPPPTPTSSGIHRSVWLQEYEKLIREQQNKNVEVQKAAAVLSKAGGHARAAALTPKQRSNIASQAAIARWKR